MECCNLFFLVMRLVDMRASRGDGDVDARQAATSLDSKIKWVECGILGNDVGWFVKDLILQINE
eukprot:13070271-Ditylum_brightwellii.AAC.1